MEWKLKGLEVAGSVHNNKTADGDDSADDGSIHVPGSMGAPLQKDGTAATHFEYTVGDIQCKNLGFSPFLGEAEIASRYRGHTCPKMPCSGAVAA